MQNCVENQPKVGQNKSSDKGAINASVALTTTRTGGAMMADAEDTTTSGKAPAFQFYPNDFLSDANVVAMSLQERGAYITLICLCWQQGSLSSNTERLARLCGVPAGAFKKLWPALERCFRPGEPGRLIHPRLERERRKQSDYIAGQSERGKHGAAKRWHKPSDSAAMSAPSPANGGAIVLPMAKNSSSSSSSSSEKKISSSVSTDAETGMRAGEFIEWYAAEYPKRQKGVPYRRQDVLDFPVACSLVATWPDDRLRRMAEVFLETNHPFAADGRRSIKQFAALAEWCDVRLKEHGR